MTLADAIAHLERKARIHLELANAPRTSDVSRAAAERHRVDATAIAMVLAALPEGARQ